MHKDLLNTLVCPQCHHTVSFHKARQALQCDVCRLAFPVQDGIPVMLIDQASPL